MHWIDQTEFVHSHGTGNCFNACVSSLLDIPLEECSEVTPTGKGIFFREWQKWFKARGWYLDHSPAHLPPSGFSIVSVNTERLYPEGHREAGKPISHACLCLEGEICFDPYPGYSGAYSVNLYYVLTPYVEGMDDD